MTDIYNKISKDRKTFSKYNSKAEMARLELATDCYLSRELVNNFHEIEKAISLIQKYERKLNYTRELLDR